MPKQEGWEKTMGLDQEWLGAGGFSHIALLIQIKMAYPKYAFPNEQRQSIFIGNFCDLGQHARPQLQVECATFTLEGILL